LLDLRQQTGGGSGDIGNRGIERGLVGFGRCAEAAHLADELESRGGNLVRGGGDFGSAKDFDAPAHLTDYYAHVAEFLHEPGEPDGSGVVLTHGAGSNCTSPSLVAVAEALSAAGSVVLRYDLPYRVRRPFGPPSPATAAGDRDGIRAAALRMRGMVSGPLILAGHSYGGRQSSMLAAEEPDLADGLLLLSYPLHPPGRPGQLRTGHFPSLRTPALFVSGVKDAFGSVEEMRAAIALIPGRTRLVSVPGVGHDLGKGKVDLGKLVGGWRV